MALSLTFLLCTTVPFNTGVWRRFAGNLLNAPKLTVADRNFAMGHLARARIFEVSRNTSLRWCTERRTDSAPEYKSYQPRVLKDLQSLM